MSNPIISKLHRQLVEKYTRLETLETQLDESDKNWQRLNIDPVQHARDVNTFQAEIVKVKREIEDLEELKRLEGKDGGEGEKGWSIKDAIGSMFKH